MTLALATIDQMTALLHGRVGQKVDPNSVGLLAVLGDGLLLVADPVQVPPVNGGRVVHSKNVDRPDFKISVFKLSDRGEADISVDPRGHGSQPEPNLPERGPS
jgi:hypothetical protein